MGKRPDRLNWKIVTMRVALFEHDDGRALSVSAIEADSAWFAVALEQGAGVGVAAVLNNHAHADLGNFESLEDLGEAVEQYRTSWQATTAPAPPCACADIELR